MKALSMKQPVPELILEKKKTIELRTWNTKFRGKFYIHASNGFFESWMERFNFDKNKITKGAIVGTAEIVSVKQYNNIKEFESDKEKHLGEKPKKLPMYGYLLSNPQRLEKPIQYKGQLNFFDVKIQNRGQLNLSEVKL